MKKDYSEFSLTYQASNGMRSFVDFLVDQGNILIVRDSAGVVRLSTMKDDLVVTSLADEQEQAISDYVDAYFFYKEAQGQPYIMNNFFPQTDKTEFEKDNEVLIDWSRHFVSLMDEAVKSDRTNSISDDFSSLNAVLSRIIRKTIKATEIEDDEQENANRLKIKAWLRQEDICEYDAIKEKLLVAVVVQELFYQLFLIPEEERDSAGLLEEYLSLIQEGKNTRLLNYIRLSKKDCMKMENCESIVLQLKRILHNKLYNND